MGNPSLRGQSRARYRRTALSPRSSSTGRRRGPFGGAAAARCRLFFISYTLVIYQGGILMVVLLPYLFTVQNTTHAGQSAVRFRVYQSQLLADASYKQNTK